TLIIVTHDNALAERTKCIITIKDGKVISDRVPIGKENAISHC
ncbi:macrolide ABC transporter ATP-binding protein, partial [Vibrio parahaemolyticus]|nr:macrolide ABC transporter ATP-binding protein [Vibrio parahaemolyticus]